MKRLVEFVRSVLPADPAQLLLLGGTVCLVIAPRLRWWPAGMVFASARTATWFGSSLELLRVWFVYPIIFASVAGYYVCFWPGRRPVRRILRVVFGPALAGTGLLLGRVIYPTASVSSVFESTHQWAQSIPWKSMPGLHFALLGLLLIGLFLSRLALGITSLPLSLPGPVVFDGEEGASWRGLQFAVWFLVGPLFLSSMLVFLILMLQSAMAGQPWRHLQSPWFPGLSGIVETGLSLGIILFLIGRSERHVLRKWMRLPAGKYAALAFLFPVASTTVISAGQYAFDRFEWARQQFGTIEAPEFESYFHRPDIWLLLLFFSALFEEMIFRGVLQPKFIKRYGLYRGITLVGFSWSAFHFVSDFAFSRADDQKALEILTFRILMCVTLSFVLGWLALRSGSVFPAAIAHAFYNIFVYSNFGFPFVGKETVRVILWAVLALLLFRYWPPALTEVPETSREMAAKIAAVE